VIYSFCLKSGYCFDLRVFLIWSVLITAYLVTNIFFSDNSLYVYCPDQGRDCINPVYGKCDLPVCQEAVLSPGFEYGKKKHFLFDAYGFLFFSSLMVAFFVNHWLFNKGKTFLGGVE
jgi:hypothetical protein